MLTKGLTGDCRWGFKNHKSRCCHQKVQVDEIPQLINVLCGDMSFVGTRPEVEKYVMAYTPAMMATLLMPAGITSEASIRYKDEDSFWRLQMMWITYISTRCCRAR